MMKFRFKLVMLPSLLLASLLVTAGGVYPSEASSVFIHNSSILNIPSSPHPDPGFGVWMDGSQLFDINNNNYFEGLGLLHQGASYGVVVTNSSTGGRTIDHNQFAKTLIGTQAEGDNPQLDIRCNTYTAHDAHAWSVLLDKNLIGVLKDQGDGVAQANIRPQNTFDVFTNCTNPESHFYAEFKFKYFVNNFNPGNPYHPICSSPILVQGSSLNDDIINSLQLGLEEKCVIDDPCPVLPCEQFKMAINNENDPLKKQELINQLIMIYQEKATTQDDSLLVGYLQQLNTVNTNKLLVPLLIKNNDWNSAQAILSSINLSTQENIDFAGYYQIVIDKLSLNSSKTMLTFTPNQVSTLQSIASNATSVATLAQNLLQKNELAYYKHSIMPINNKVKRQLQADLSNKNAMELIEIAPNPNKGLFSISMQNFDNASKYEFSISDLLGQVLHRNKLNEQVATVNSIMFNNGTYQLIIYKNAIPISTARIVVIN